jgi:hypothetical protein
MLRKLADNRDPESLAARLRRQRLAWFAELLEGLPEPVSVLDVGGSMAFWRTIGAALLPRCRVTLLNLVPEPEAPAAGITVMVADGRHMQGLADRSYDLCFSNSVIEHAGTLADQPYRHFPIEPHFLFPGWQYLPVAMRAGLHRRFRLGWMGRQPDADAARVAVEQIRLLDRHTLRQLFPDGTLREERLGPLIKSLVAIRPPRLAEHPPLGSGIEGERGDT